MASVAIHGKQGTVSFSGLTFLLQSFSMDAVADTAEASVMDTSTVSSATHWKDFLPGYKTWSGTAEVLEGNSGVGMAALGTETTLTMDTTAGFCYSGTAICTGIGITQDAQGIPTASCTFQGTSTLVLSLIHI